jgi:hypothetical protein
MRGAQRVLKENLRGRIPLGRSEADKRIILKWIFEKWDEGIDGSIWVKIGTDGGLL